MRSSSDAVRLPGLDAQGHVVRVVPATEFRRPQLASRGHWREQRRRLPRPVAGTTGREDAGR